MYFCMIILNKHFNCKILFVNDDKNSLIYFLMFLIIWVFCFRFTEVTLPRFMGSLKIKTWLACVLILGILIGSWPLQRTNKQNKRKKLIKYKVNSIYNKCWEGRGSKLLTYRMVQARPRLSNQLSYKVAHQVQVNFSKIAFLFGPTFFWNLPRRQIVRILRLIIG